MMIKLGLTGSIGMGKSETARMFRQLGVPVYDSDAAVHALYAKGGAAVEPIGTLFPDAVIDGSVDRQILGAKVLGKPDALKQLEQIVHPLVGLAQVEFLASARNTDQPLVVLDIPLLFETGGDKRVDKVLVVSCPPDLQRARVLARPGMTVEKLDAILAKQTPDDEKRRRADYVIMTDQGLDRAFADVSALVEKLKNTSLDIGSDHA